MTAGGARPRVPRLLFGRACLHHIRRTTGRTLAPPAIAYHDARYDEGRQLFDEALAIAERGKHEEVRAAVLANRAT